MNQKVFLQLISSNTKEIDYAILYKIYKSTLK